MKKFGKNKTGSIERTGAGARGFSSPNFPAAPPVHNNEENSMTALEAARAEMVRTESIRVAAEDAYYAAGPADEAAAESAMDAAEEAASDARYEYRRLAPEAKELAEEVRQMERASARLHMERD